MEHKNCPFCGGTPILKTATVRDDYRTDYMYAYIMCEKCKMKTGGIKIAKIWNGCEESYTTKIQDKEVAWQVWDTRL